ncbi:hypothetical protein QYH69_32235 [Paraburkholderia sp. SARCC-3016]|uniref:hypothetical protein n=1 Tax=Paraburkholderia sp. SARCC-3016 TaxID=3058611 RepID=UPI00280900FE|nr:hypothetical protein [Paraburkholderia sp. SARCC-3016]MDQ7981893.1 hypothetical protein [Paraburkholderia sp. SARCC-3016]
MTTRRYESGRLVSEKPAPTTKPVWGKKDGESLGAMPVQAAEKPAIHEAPAALTVRNPADSALDAAAQALVDARADGLKGTIPTLVAQTPKVARRPPPAQQAQATVPSPSTPASPPPVVTAVDEPILDTSDMRKFLLQQMVRASKGEITSETVKNITTLSQQVYNATSLELKAAAILKNPDRSIGSLKLVSPRDDAKP